MKSIDDFHTTMENTYRLCLLFFLLFPVHSHAGDRVIITLHSKYSGHACELAKLLPTCITQLKCYGRSIVVSTDRCGQPWGIVETEIYSRLHGYGEPESIEKDYMTTLQSTHPIQEGVYDFNADNVILTQSKVPTASQPLSIAWATREWHKDGWYGINSLSLLEQYPQYRDEVDASNVVAILDSGLKRDAATLAMFDEIVPGVDLVSDDTISNDGDGRDPDWGDPGDGYAPSCPTTPSSWHGHKLASIISGHVPAGQVQDVSGAYDGITRVPILPVRVLGTCKQGWASDLNDALRYAVGDRIDGVPSPAKNATVIVMSLVGKAPSCPQYLQATIDSIRASHPDVVLLAAAGNDHEHVSGVFPANCRGVISVSSTGRDGIMTVYSNLGATVSAPGGGDDGVDAVIALSPEQGVTMSIMSGTSVSTAVAAAYVALGRQVYGNLFYLGNSMTPYSNACAKSRCGGGILSFLNEKNAQPIVNEGSFRCSPNAYRVDSNPIDPDTVRFPRYTPGNEPHRPLHYYDSLRNINLNTQEIEQSVVPCSSFDPSAVIAAAEYEVPTGSWNFQFSVDSIPQEDWDSMTIQGVYDQKPIRLYGDKTLWQTPTATFITYLNRVEIDLKTSIANMPDFATQSAGFFTVDVTIPLELSKAGEATQAGLGVRVKLGGMGLHLQASTDVVNQGWSTYSFLDADGNTVEQNPTPLDLMEYVSVTDDDRYKSIGKLRILFDLANKRVATLFTPDRVFEDGNGFVPVPGTQAWVPFQRDCTEDGCTGGMWYTHDATAPSAWDLFTLEFLGSPMHVDNIDFAMYPEDYFVDENTYEVVRPCGADPLQNVLVANPPAYKFHASQFRNNQFHDSQSNDAVDVQIQGNPYLIVDSAHGATAPMVALVGDADTDGLTFPNNTLGQDFTVCALFRLRTNAAGPTNRLFLNTRSSSPETDSGYWNMAPDDTNTDWQAKCSTSGGGFSYGIGVAAHGPLDLHINHPNASGAVDWAFISILVWHKVLSDEDINTVLHWMKSSLTTLKINLENPNGCGAKQSKISDCTTDTANVDFKPWAMWHAADWDAGTNILVDTSGNNRHSQPATGTITYAYEAGNGANVSTASIIGGQLDSIVFPNSAPPKFFTICSLSRWVDPVQHHPIIGADVADRTFAYKDHGATPANLDSVQVKFSQSTWYHGHGPASRGAVSYGDVKTDAARLATLPGSDTDWIVVCSKNTAGAQSTLVNGDIDVSDSEKTVRVARAFKKNFRGVAAGNIGFNVV